MLDTHVALWWAGDDERLSASVIAAIEDAGNTSLLSAVVPWEVAIKRALNKLDATDAYLEILAQAQAQRLAISFEHVRAVERLPAHHRDPFDRLLIAQALTEDATIVTNDPLIARYDVPVLW